MLPLVPGSSTTDTRTVLSFEKNKNGKGLTLSGIRAVPLGCQLVRKDARKDARARAHKTGKLAGALRHSLGLAAAGTGMGALGTLKRADVIELTVSATSAFWSST